MYKINSARTASNQHYDLQTHHHRKKHPNAPHTLSIICSMSNPHKRLANKYTSQSTKTEPSKIRTISNCEQKSHHCPGIQVRDYIELSSSISSQLWRNSHSKCVVVRPKCEYIYSSLQLWRTSHPRLEVVRSYKCGNAEYNPKHSTTVKDLVSQV